MPIEAQRSFLNRNIGKPREVKVNTVYRDRTIKQRSFTGVKYLHTDVTTIKDQETISVQIAEIPEARPREISGENINLYDNGWVIRSRIPGFKTTLRFR